jgi:hypothetical protein
MRIERPCLGLLVVSQRCGGLCAALCPTLVELLFSCMCLCVIHIWLNESFCVFFVCKHDLMLSIQEKFLRKRIVFVCICVYVLEWICAC